MLVVLVEPHNDKSFEHIYFFTLASPYVDQLSKGGVSNSNKATAIAIILFGGPHQCQMFITNVTEIKPMYGAVVIDYIQTFSIYSKPLFSNQTVIYIV